MSMLVCKISFGFHVFVTAPTVRNSYILAGVYFIFLKKRPGANLKIFRYLIWTSDQKKSYQVTQNLAVFCKIMGLILG